MNFLETNFSGLLILKNDRIHDERGWFEKKYHSSLFSKFLPDIGESYTSVSKKNVLRGLHYQRGSNAQSKLVTCLAGSFIDIAVDLRRHEPTFGQTFIYEVDSRKPISLFIPGEFAHGVYALEDNTILLNFAGNVYAPGNEGGIRWNTVPELRFISDPIVSEKDSNLPSIDQILEQL